MITRKISISTLIAACAAAPLANAAEYTATLEQNQGWSSTETLTDEDTVNLTYTASNYGEGAIDLSGFNGMLNYTGNYRPQNVTIGDGATINFSSYTESSASNVSSMWGGSPTFANTVVFQTNYGVNGSGSGNTATYTFSGNVSTATGATLDVYNYATANFNGTFSGALSVRDGASATFSGTSVSLSSLTLSNGGSASVSGETTLNISSAETTFSGTGMLSVAYSNISFGDGAKLTLGENFTLDLGSQPASGDLNLREKLLGSGMLKVSSVNHKVVYLDSNFTGTLAVTGNYNPYDNQLNSAATLSLSSSSGASPNSMWGTGTIGSKVKFETDYGIGTGDTAAWSCTFNGSVLAAEGTTITVNTPGNDTTVGTVTFAGEADFDGLTVSAGTVKFSGSTTIDSLSVSGGTVNLAGTTTAVGAVTVDGGQLQVSSGVTLSQAAITVVLGDAYLSTAALAGAGTIASGTVITLSMADADAAGVSLLTSNATEQYTYQIFGGDLTHDGVTLQLSEELKNAGWTLSDSGATVTLTIPEPSAFGLLAGLGALALVASRRRRTKRA